MKDIPIVPAKEYVIWDGLQELEFHYWNIWSSQWTEFGMQVIVRSFVQMSVTKMAVLGLTGVFRDEGLVGLLQAKYMKNVDTI